MPGQFVPPVYRCASSLDYPVPMLTSLPTAPAGDQLATRRYTALTTMPLASTVAYCYAAMAFVMILLWAGGALLNRDLDDLLKLHEIRTLLATGDIFDRTLPGIVQPEPYITHWPWIVDLPYAAFTAVFAPILGREAALAAACFTVPLLLLLPTLYFYALLIKALGFRWLAAALPVAALFAMRGFFEFAPDRIDYHNLQILLLLAGLVLVLSTRSRDAYINGAFTALALAISVEFAPFYVLLAWIYALDFVFDRPGAAQRSVAYGCGLLFAAAVLFAAIVPPGAYGAARCDTYSLPHFTLLLAGGAVFCLSPLLACGDRGWLARAMIVGFLGVAGVASVMLSFPQCLGGPYAAMDAYTRHVAIELVRQETSLFQRRDFVLSGSFPSMAVIFVGALAPALTCVLSRSRDRALIVVALFCVLSLVLGIAYLRYFRYATLFSGIGMLFVLEGVLPSGIGLKTWLRGRTTLREPNLMLLVPGLLLALSLGLFHLLVRPAQALPPAADVAGSCNLWELGNEYSWPNGARILAPPSVASHILAAMADARVVAVPNHPSARGIERAYRFFDPKTSDPRAYLDAAGATHVVVCAQGGAPHPTMKAAYPLATALMHGHPPTWLMSCPTGEASPLRVYRYPAAGESTACPSVRSGK